MWGQGPGDGQHRIQQALRRLYQRNQIPRGPRPQGYTKQGNLTFFSDLILMTDPLRFDSVGGQFFLAFFPFCRCRSPPAAAAFDACNVPSLPGIPPIEHDKV